MAPSALGRYLHLHGRNQAHLVSAQASNVTSNHQAICQEGQIMPGSKHKGALCAVQVNQARYWASLTPQAPSKLACRTHQGAAHKCTQSTPLSCQVVTPDLVDCRG